MKKFLVSALVLLSVSANAVEVVNVLETALPAFQWTGRTEVTTSFYVDQNTHEGFAKVSVQEERFHVDHTGGWSGCPNQVCIPGPIDIGPQYVTLFSQTVKVANLTLEGDKLVYRGVYGATECATLGVSRVFKRPTLYLSGKCDLEGQVVKTEKGHNVTVVFTAQ